MTNASSGNSSHPMNFLLDEELNLPSAGEIRTGYVVTQRSNEILVDINAKSEGVIDSREVSSLGPDALAYLAVGNEVLVYVVNPEDGNGNIILSYTKAKEEEDWVKAVTLMESQEVCECSVVGFNRGGVLVDVFSSGCQAPHRTCAAYAYIMMSLDLLDGIGSTPCDKGGIIRSIGIVVRGVHKDYFRMTKHRFDRMICLCHGNRTQ